MSTLGSKRGVYRLPSCIVCGRQVKKYEARFCSRECCAAFRRKPTELYEAALIRARWSFEVAAEELGLKPSSFRSACSARRVKRPDLRGRPKTIKIRSREGALEKFCMGCVQWLPLDTEFSLHPRGALGRDNRCKACVADARRLKRRKDGSGSSEAA